MGELRIDRLTKTYARREGWNATRYLKVFQDISFTVRDGEFVSVIGSSGCGKSTLLSIAGGLSPATSGTIYVDDRPIKGPGLDRGIVFQEFALFPWLTVLGNIAFGLKAKGLGRKERDEIARKYCQLVGLSGFEDYHPHRLSGGMRQRVGLARALAIEPAALLMDEPFGALDAQTREAMQNALSDISMKTKGTILFITHDIREAIYLSDRVLVLSGRPASVADELVVDLPRPRHRHDPVFQEYEARLEAAIGGGSYVAEEERVGKVA
ncbi:ABC transporter ATP-binding protein [Afifella sp. IM 167]|uniref:ABC transporter ATP-binding protein n=1 Tax=Afifella sp. IM 167 TaxID=2033586 RepID=UPI001CCBFB0D|nr:ABC transporter ATP-binding protein [Afifella sp. IM 167]MBZ8133738.1 ABC transporter ATP-binding protein [Afifella sp. IM 167]